MPVLSETRPTTALIILSNCIYGIATTVGNTVKQSNITIEFLREFISENCLRKDGKVSGSCSRMSWWEKHGFQNIYTAIVEFTYFLDPLNCTFPQRVWHINNSLEPVKCRNSACNNQSKWVYGQYHQYCGRECVDVSESVKKFHATCQERYGVKSPMESSEFRDRLKRNLTEKYGVDSYSKTQGFRDKFKSTCQERYGVDNPAQLSEFNEKARQTTRERFGVDYALQCDAVLSKRTQTNIEKYGSPSPMGSHEVRKLHQDNMNARYGVTNFKHTLMSEYARECLNDAQLLVQWLETKTAPQIASDLDVDNTTVHNYLHRHGIHHLVKIFPKSMMEVQMAEFLTTHGINYIANDRKILGGQELDLYIPSHKLAIELCGVYWHTERTKHPTYHYDKWKKCDELGITLLTYFDDEISSKLSVIQSKLLYTTGALNGTRIGARQLILRTPSTSEEREFLDKNHLQGFLKARTYSIGAYYGDILVGIMCATQRSAYLEITRFAVSLEYICPGLFSKMMSRMICDLAFSGAVVSFSDNCHGNGAVYRASGFTLDSEIGPGYSYTIGGRPRENRQRYMKSKIASKFKIDISDKTEKELMQSLGYERVWDCGKRKWIKYV